MQRLRSFELGKERKKERIMKNYSVGRHIEAKNAYQNAINQCFVLKNQLKTEAFGYSTTYLI